MGQYYKPVIGHKEDDKFVIDAYLVAWDYGHNGAKLMEHSYIGNTLTGAVENLLGKGGQFNGKCLVWAGDYANGENGTEEENDDNLYMITRAMGDSEQMKPLTDIKDRHFRYAINLTKMQFVDMDKVQENKYGLRIHPVPLLCAEGNGRGCGDYEGTYMKCIGTWARDAITFDNEIPDGYTELKVNFKEDR